MSTTITSNTRTGPAAFSLHNCYTFWISRLAATMQEAFNQRLKSEDITWPQWMLLNALATEVASTPALLADAIGVDRSAITRLLDRLEKKNLVVREHDKLDRRSINLLVTDKGQAMIETINRAAQEHEQQFLRTLHSTEHRSFKGNLQKLLKAGGVDSYSWI